MGVHLWGNGLCHRYSVPVIGTSNKIQGRNTLKKRIAEGSPFLYENIGGLEIMTNLTKYEMETVVNYNAGEQTATVYTRDKSVIRKLDRLVADYPDSYKMLKQTDIDKTYSMPKSYVTYRKPRMIRDEQREQARQRMEKLNSADD